MNRKLVQLYVANKLALHVPEIAEAKSKLDRHEFVKVVMAQPARFCPPDVLRQCEEAVLRKYGIERRPTIFRNPTVGQYISDFTSEYTVDDILEFFKQETGLRKEMIAKSIIGGQLIMRPALIWMVEHLELATGRQLTKPESDAPLAYLGENITLKEIAKYFSVTSKSEAISRLRRRYCHYTSNLIKDSLCRFRVMVLSSYRLNAEIPENLSDDDLLRCRVMEIAPEGFPVEDWDLPLMWLEEDLNIQLPAFSTWVDRETTVEDLVEVALRVKRTKLEKRF